MAATVGDRPGPKHLLRRPDPSKPYGPKNWEWLDALRRQPGETRKAFNARKWASRRAREPEYEKKRWRQRKYGISEERYREMLEEQRGLCGICEEPEISIDPKTSVPKALCIDHCHRTGKVRALLCWRCNVVIGKVEERPEVLRAMVKYIADWA